MARSSSREVLFLSSAPGDLALAATLLFQTAARKLGLNWNASARTIPDSQTPPAKAKASPLLKELRGLGFRDAEVRSPIAELEQTDLLSAALVVVLTSDMSSVSPLPAVDSLADRTLFWSVPAADPLASIERETNELLARILGGRPFVEKEVPVVAQEPAPRKRPIVKIGRETKGRRGKGVTILSDLPLDETALNELATLLKTRCGTGGTVRDGRVEIQGDQRDRLATEMEKLGYQVKRVGG